MAEYMTKQQPDLYKRILANDLPALTPENRKWVLGLMGAAIFLNQKDSDLSLAISEKALEIAPDDYGVWEHRILLLSMAHRNKEVLKTFETALERFKGQSPDKTLAFINALGKHCRSLGQLPPRKTMDLYRKLDKLNSAPPKIVLDNLPKKP